MQADNALKARRIFEDESHGYTFESINYDLLRALHLHVPTGQQESFVHSLALVLNMPPACGGPTNKSKVEFPSELPLIVEFAFRNGGKQHVFSILSEAQPFPGHVSLVRHLQDMISLNYRILNEEEYDRLAFSMERLGGKARAKLYGRSMAPDRHELFNGLGRVHVNRYCVEIDKEADAIVELCRKAKYLYLKGVLLEGLNLETNQDKGAVVSHLEQLGFSPVLAQSLNEAERLYHGPANGFELKSSVGLRLTLYCLFATIRSVG